MLKNLLNKNCKRISLLAVAWLLLLLQGGYCIVEAASTLSSFNEYTILWWRTKAGYGETCNLTSFDYIKNSANTIVLPNDFTMRDPNGSHTFLLDTIGKSYLYPGDEYGNVDFGPNVTTLISDSITEVDCIVQAPNLKYVEFGANGVDLNANAFSDCKKLEKVKGKIIGSGSVSSEYNNQYGGCFECCYNLKEVDVLDSKPIFYDRSFKGCSSITNIKSALGTNVFTSLSAYSFSGCRSMPYLITLGGYLEQGVFEGWTNKQKVIILGNIIPDVDRGLPSAPYFNKGQVIYGYANAKTTTNRGIVTGTLKKFVESQGAVFIEIGGTVNLEIDEKYKSIGDNTEIQAVVTGTSETGNRLEIYDTKTGSLLYQEEITGTGTKVIDKTVALNLKKVTSMNTTIEARIVAGKDFIMGDTTIYKKGDILGSSTTHNINKLEQLSIMKEIGMTDNDLAKFIILDDKNRFYSNNVENQTLTNEVNATINGIYIIGQNTDSEILKRFLIAE